jgi:hypothetical protein
LAHTVNRFLDFHIARDAGVFLRFSKLLPLYGDLSHRDNLRRLIGDLYRDYFFKQRFLERGLDISQDTLLDLVVDPTYTELIDQILKATAASHHKSGWGNKKPSYALSTEEIEALFPKARFVHIVRDGRDVVLSMRKASKSLFEQNWYFAARDWRSHVIEGRRTGQSLGPRYMEIRYESLLQDPVTALKSILDLVDAESSVKERLDTAAEEVRSSVRPGNFDKWKRQMPRRALRIVEQAAGDALSDFGYEVSDPTASRTPFSKSAIWMFQVDRVFRKLFVRDFKKTLIYRTHRTLARGRARLGQLSQSSGS